MKNKVEIISLLVSVLLIFSSCQSIYVNPEPPVTDETAPLVEVDMGKEYFTTGELRREVTAEGGCIYNDSWIYVETTHYNKLAQITSDGRPVYHNAQLFRIVKANAHTGQVSSICLDPSCTHSPGSGCISVAPDNASLALVQNIVGDWLTFSYSCRTEEYGIDNLSYIYNLKTGELLTVFEQELGDTIMTKWQSRCSVGNQLYGVKNVLDYTNTGYIPGENSASDFKPTTKSYLCVYDFDTRQMSELFEIPANYRITEITNKRFILGNESNTEFYSIDKNGENLTRLDALDFNPMAVRGTYAYGINSIDKEFYIYDLLTNTKKTIDTDGYKLAFVALDLGIIKVMATNTEEYDKYNDNFDEKLQQYVKEQSALRPDVGQSKLVQEFRKMRNDALYTMGTSIYLISNPLGEGEEKLVFSKEKALIEPVHITSDYLYCRIITDDNSNESEEDNGMSNYFVNINTGEVVKIPLFDSFFSDDQTISK